MIKPEKLIRVAPGELNKIVRTLIPLGRPHDEVVSFTDGDTVVVVSFEGYDYPRYKTPRLKPEVYARLDSRAIERLLQRKATHDDVDYVIG